MELNDIIYEKDDGIAVATVNRPEVLNAFRTDTYSELNRILDDAETDKAVRILIITGNGRAFCAGEDLKELSAIDYTTHSMEESRKRVEMLQNVTRCIVNMPKVVIAALNGFAVGFGAELTIACDIRIAAEEASFSFPEVKRALFETNGVMYLLPRIIGLGRTMELLLSGRDLPAAEALDLGLVSSVVPKKQLLPSAVDLAKTIKTNAPVSVRLIKEALHKTYDLTLEEVLDLEVDGALACLKTEDLKESLKAFAEKRQPRYKGE